MRCPDTAAFRLSPPLVARPLTRLAIRSGKNLPDLQMQPQPARHRLRAIALARSAHPAAMGESEPSVTLPRTPPPAIVRYQQEPILQSYPAIDATDTSASRAWIHVGQPAPKTALTASRKILYSPRSAWGRTVPDRDSARFGHESSLVTIRRVMSRFLDFGQPFSSQDGHAGEKKHLGSCLEKQERATGGFGGVYTDRKPGKMFYWRGFRGCGFPGAGGARL